MGEAKRRAKAGEGCASASDAARVAWAVRRIQAASSRSSGRDCYAHACLARALCEALGVASRVVVGHAMWRVGEGDGDVIVHAPGYGVGSAKAAPYHAWVRIADHLLDVTTYQLRQKAAELSALDAAPLNVQWCPDYLFVPLSASLPKARVISERAGMFHYREDRRMQRALFAPQAETDDTDGFVTATAVPSALLQAALLLYAQPSLRAIGPNDLKQLLGAA